MKTSFIATVFNEEKTVAKLLESLFIQTKSPDEVVIVDGLSTDKTVNRINSFVSKFKQKGIAFKFIIKKGNRSVGRNEAITNATGDIILCSDAGCILDKDWIKNMIKPFEEKNVDVVSGYYEGEAENVFQKCLIPYVLVMPGRVDPKKFLPATRSMAFRKKIWGEISGFPEQFSNNEDYVFAKKLQKMKARIIFQKNAFVYWLPRKNFKEAFTMFFCFASGDAEAKIFRPKVGLVFTRYALGILILIFAIIRKDLFLMEILLLSIAFYVFWAIFKNYKYVQDIRAFVILPILQITADLAVMLGTIFGLYNIWGTKKM